MRRLRRECKNRLDANCLSAFASAVDAVFSAVLQEKIKRGKPYVRDDLFSADSVAVVVGIAGDVEGRVIYSFRSAYAREVAGVMCGMLVEELDELSASALAELCNMISGQAVTNLYGMAGKRASITPPTLLVGDKMKIFVKPPVLCLPFNGGSFEVNCAFVR